MCGCGYGCGFASGCGLVVVTVEVVVGVEVCYVCVDVNSMWVWGAVTVAAAGVRVWV